MRPSKNPYLIEALALEVRVRRDELGLSQEDLAGRMQMDCPNISMIEVARKQPTLSVQFRLAQGLDLILSALMERVEKRYTRALCSSSPATGCGGEDSLIWTRERCTTSPLGFRYPSNFFLAVSGSTWSPFQCGSRSLPA